MCTVFPGAELAHTSGSSTLAAAEQDLLEVLSSMLVSASGHLEVCETGTVCQCSSS